MDNNGIETILKTIKEQVKDKENELLNSFEDDLKISFDDYNNKMQNSISDMNSKLKKLSEKLEQLENSLTNNILKSEELSTLQKSEKKRV